ncbi:hypothetical protein KSF73_05045 [Burkholderiaceae bacterium DAT-1]|nr:hypothetical protein [Burkholderiaceae bacterium DAT-1]
MHADEIFNIQKSISERTLHLLRRFLPLMAPVAKYAQWQNEDVHTVGCLASAAARSSESTLLLCAYGQVWDAEVPARSTFEATLKFAYMLQAPETFAARHREYACELFEIGQIKNHQKAYDFLSTVSNPDAIEWEPIRQVVMPKAQAAELRAKYPKTYRQTLEQKWGFTGLIQSLSSSGDPVFEGFRGLAYGYSTSSHIAHADYAGVTMPLERDERHKADSDAIHLAHLVRLVSDICTCQFLRLLVAYRFIGEDPAPVFEARHQMDELQTSFGPIYHQWLAAEYERKR